jgi:hypothetical protein
MKSKLFVVMVCALSVITCLQSQELTSAEKERQILLSLLKDFSAATQFPGEDKHDMVKIVRVKGNSQEDCVSNCGKWFSSPYGQIKMVSRKNNILDLVMIGGKEVKDLGCWSTMNTQRSINKNQFGTYRCRMTPTTTCQMYTVVDSADQLTIQEGQVAVKFASQGRHVPGFKLRFDLNNEEDRKTLAKVVQITS